MAAQITKHRQTEPPTQHNSCQTDASEIEAVRQRPTLLPAEILTTGELPLYETRPILWPLLTRPALLTIIGIVIIIFTQNIEAVFIRAIEGLVPLELILPIIGWPGIALSLAGLLGILVRYLRWRYTVYTLTNRRIFYQSGIIGKSYADCSLRKVQTVYLEIPILGRIFDFGTIRMATAGTGSIELQWEGVRRPRDVHRILNETIEQYGRDGA